MKAVPASLCGFGMVLEVLGGYSRVYLESHFQLLTPGPVTALITPQGGGKTNQACDLLITRRRPLKGL